MWNAVFNNGSLQALQETVNFTERRHALLAGNIANMDTPDYQTRDVSVAEFQSHLQDAMTAQSKSRTSRFGSRSNDFSNEELAEQALQRARDTSKEILYHIGNDVSLEQQVTEIAKNQAMHNTAISIMRSQFRTLNMAVAESVNV